MLRYHLASADSYQGTLSEYIANWDASDNSLRDVTTWPYNDVIPVALPPLCFRRKQQQHRSQHLRRGDGCNSFVACCGIVMERRPQHPTLLTEVFTHTPARDRCHIYITWQTRRLLLIGQWQTTTFLFDCIIYMCSSAIMYMCSSYIIYMCSTYIIYMSNTYILYTCSLIDTCGIIASTRAAW